MEDAKEEQEALVALELVRRIGSGDAHAETDLIRRYSRGLLLMLRRRTGDPNLSDDLHQETFSLVLEKIRQRKVGQPEKLAAYIYRVAVNLVIADYRKQRRWASSPVEPILDRIEDPSSDPHTTATAAEEARLVRQVVAELKNDRDRQILYRYYLAEEGKEQILADLGLSGIHFNRVLYRARQRFAELWRKHGKNLGSLSSRPDRQNSFSSS